MGGRGASSTSGGATGGLDMGHIISTRSLVSERGASQKEVDDVLGVMSDVEEKYGVRINDAVVSKLDLKGSTTMGYYDAGGNFGINEKFFDSARVDRAYDRNIESGFHPKRGNKSGTEALAAHEMGHAVTDEAARRAGLGDWQLDAVSNKIVGRAKSKLGAKSTSDVRKGISGYAQESNSEAVAEAFADVYCNGSNASAESKAVVAELDAYFRR